LPIELAKWGRVRTSVRFLKDLVAIRKKLKANEKILLRVYSQGRSGYVALEPK
jgi:hypothetical protein